MIISDLNYLETISEAPSIIGGRRRWDWDRRPRKRHSARGDSAGSNRGNTTVINQIALTVIYIFVGCNNTGDINPVINTSNTSTTQQTNQANDMLL